MTDYERDDKVFDPRIAETIEEETKKSAGQPENDTLTLSSGVVVQARKISPLLVAKIQRKYKPKPPPKVWMEELQREVANPDHPDYQRYLKDLQDEEGLRLVEVLVGAGTKIVSVPKNVPQLEDDAWIEELQAILYDEEVPTEGQGRVLAYLKYVIFTDLEEMTKVSQLVARKAGISAEEVEDQLEGFRGNEG